MEALTVFNYSWQVGPSLVWQPNWGYNTSLESHRIYPLGLTRYSYKIKAGQRGNLIDYKARKHGAGFQSVRDS